jgi:hypothetical protein
MVRERVDRAQTIAEGEEESLNYGQNQKNREIQERLKDTQLSGKHAKTRRP